jgi:BirA family transcriptional regulator, biotin operon repressor / biotin---[acetyl-CoA-carboxylase] ligase
MIYIGQPMIILPSVDSTNNYAMAQLRAGLASSGQAWLALEQTGGRGQRQKSWLTEPGSNITMSIALKPTLQLQQQFLLSAGVALGVYDFFFQLAGDETKIKWPNDICWRDRKAGGILIDNLVTSEVKTGNNWAWSVVGIGININQAVFPAAIAHAVSLLQITGRRWDIIELAKALCSALQQRMLELNNPAALMKNYNRVLYKRGESVRLKKGVRVFDATVKEVNDRGELVVTTGTEEVFSFGEIEWVMSATM